MKKEEQKAYEYIYNELYLPIDSMENDIQHGYISTNKARNGREVAWYVDDNREMAVYVDTLQALTDSEIENELL